MCIYLYDLIFLIGTVFFFISFESDRGKKFVLVNQLIATLLFSIGVILYGVYHDMFDIKSFFTSFSAVSLVSLLSMIVGIYDLRKVEKVLKVLIPVVALIMFIMLPFSYGTLLILFGSVFASLAPLFERVVYIKFFYLLSSLTWLVFDIYLGSIGAVFFEIIGLFALSIYFYRYFSQEKKYTAANNKEIA